MTEVSNIVSEEISVVYEDHMGSDLTVVNASRQSFAKQKKLFSENDVGLINFLERGMRTDDQVVLKKKFLRYKNKAQHWEPFGHPQRNQACKLNCPLTCKEVLQSLYLLFFLHYLGSSC